MIKLELKKHISIYCLAAFICGILLVILLDFHAYRECSSNKNYRREILAQYSFSYNEYDRDNIDKAFSELISGNRYMTISDTSGELYKLSFIKNAINKSENRKNFINRIFRNYAKGDLPFVTAYYDRDSDYEKANSLYDYEEASAFVKQRQYIYISAILLIVILSGFFDEEHGVGNLISSTAGGVKTVCSYKIIAAILISLITGMSLFAVHIITSVLCFESGISLFKIPLFFCDGFENCESGMTVGSITVCKTVFLMLTVIFLSLLCLLLSRICNKKWLTFITTCILCLIGFLTDILNNTIYSSEYDTSGFFLMPSVNFYRLYKYFKWFSPFALADEKYFFSSPKFLVMSGSYFSYWLFPVLVSVLADILLAFIIIQPFRNRKRNASISSRPGRQRRLSLLSFEVKKQAAPFKVIMCFLLLLGGIAVFALSVHGAEHGTERKYVSRLYEQYGGRLTPEKEQAYVNFYDDFKNTISAEYEMENGYLSGQISSREYLDYRHSFHEYKSIENAVKIFSEAYFSEKDSGWVIDTAYTDIAFSFTRSWGFLLMSALFSAFCMIYGEKKQLLFVISSSFLGLSPVRKSKEKCLVLLITAAHLLTFSFEYIFLFFISEYSFVDYPMRLHRTFVKYLPDIGSGLWFVFRPFVILILLLSLGMLAFRLMWYLVTESAAKKY